MRVYRHKKRTFTLIEILTVLFLLSIVASLFLLRFSDFIFKYQDRDLLTNLSLRLERSFQMARLAHKEKNIEVKQTLDGVLWTIEKDSILLKKYELSGGPISLKIDHEGKNLGPNFFVLKNKEGKTVQISIDSSFVFKPVKLHLPE